MCDIWSYGYIQLLNSNSCEVKYPNSEQHLIFSVRFRVDAPVTRRTPHRSGREDFPHPVPQPRRFSPLRKPNRHDPVRRTTMLPADSQPASHTPPKSGYTVCGLSVPPVVPLFGSLCPASPSLQRVVWASLPRLPGRNQNRPPTIGTMFS